MNGYKCWRRTLAILSGVVSATALVGFPVVAQVNPRPSIFNEAPYNRSDRTSPSTPTLGQSTGDSMGGSTGTQQVTPTDEPTGGSTMEQMRSPDGATTETTGESDATIQRSTTVESETRIQRSTTTEPTQTAPATIDDDEVSPTTDAEEESTGVTTDDGSGGVQGLW
jgi:hypothetical protein